MISAVNLTRCFGPRTAVQNVSFEVGRSEIVALLGSYIPLAQTRADRDASRDPRASIAERYSSREQYMERIGKAANALVKDGYLLAGDAGALVKRAADHWEYAHSARN